MACERSRQLFLVKKPFYCHLLAVLLVLACLALSACSMLSGQPAAAVSPTNLSSSPVKVEVTPATATVASGGQVQFSATVTNTGNSAVTWSVTSGSISSTGLFTAPVAKSAQQVTVTAKSVANSSSQGSASATVMVPATLQIQTTTLPVGMADVAYWASLTASGGTQPYQWSIPSGSLPTGLGLSKSSGAISGTTEQTGAFPLLVQATDAKGNTANQSLTITMDAKGTNCGPPDYYCSRSDTKFSPVPNPMPSWGGLMGTNTVVNDPAFYNPIVRVTDASLGVSDGYCTGLGGSGDVPQLWNADSTIFLICDQNGAYFPIGFDPVNFKSLGPLYGMNPTYYRSGPGVFSHTDPNRFYALSRGRLQTIDYSNRTTPPTPQPVYDFTSCGIPMIGWQTTGGTDTTDTIFAAGFSTIADQGTGYFVAVYNMSTQVCYNLNTLTGVVTQYPGAKVIGTVDSPDRFYVHNVKMKGATALVVSPQKCIGSCGPHPYAWVIGTTQLFGLGHPRGGGHWATGCGKWLNNPGAPNDYTVTRDYLNPSVYESVWTVPTAQCGAAPRMSCVQPFDSHPAWLGDCSDTGPVCMATVATNNIVEYPYQNEIVCITTDGSNRQVRFAHTYSSLADGGFDAQWSIGQPSQDGNFYAWTTTAGGQFGCTDGTFNCSVSERRSDVLVVKLQ